MPQWPGSHESLLDEYIRQLPPSRKKRYDYRPVIRRFQRFVEKRGNLSQGALREWLRAVATERSVASSILHAQWVDRFLSWLVIRGAVAVNPFAEIRAHYGCRRTAPIAMALLAANHKDALEALRPPVRYASHLGPDMQEHVQRMKSLGFRYGHECRFLRFDRFLQNRQGAERESLTTLVREYAALAPSAAEKLQRISVGRLLARALERAGTPTAQPKWDRALVREMHRSRNKPYIYTEQQISLLLETALAYPSPFALLRPLTLYTMLVLAYSAGLRVGEVVGLTLKDVDLATGTIEIHTTKFFKSRRLPLSRTALAAIEKYLKERQRVGVSMDSCAPVFWNVKRPYNLVTVKALLRDVIRRTGIKSKTGRVGPRVHDLRHTFVVHRMTAWYRQGINPQSRLPYLAAYLGHRDIHSTLVYLTITQELLQHASDRFKAAGGEVLSVITRKSA